MKYEDFISEFKKQIKINQKYFSLREKKILYNFIACIKASDIEQTEKFIFINKVRNDKKI